MKGFWLALWPALLLAAGCASTPKYHLVLTGDPMVDGPNAISNGPPQDRVLWEYRTGVAALRRGRYQEAEQYFDTALDRIEGIYGYDREAKKARRYFTAEAKKTFIGEPYERVMAYYYRGVLYWMRDDYGNARACFRSGQFMDSYAEEETYASDYALLDYLEGFMNLRLGDDAASALKRAEQSARLNPLPPYNPEANVFFFVDYGRGPIKYATGEYDEQLRFRPGNSRVRSAQLEVASRTVPAPPYDDLYFQATTRGGRVMDHILANKAVFKSTTDTVGNAALISGAIMATSRSRTTQNVGLGLLAAGVISKIIAESTTPEADTRTWGSLPQFLSFVPLQLEPGPYSVTVEFLNESRQVMPQYTKTVDFEVSSSTVDHVIYVSDKSLTTETP